MAVLRSVSEDDLTNVVQLSPLGKQDHRRVVLHRAAASNPDYFLQAGTRSGSTLKSKCIILRGLK